MAPIKVKLHSSPRVKITTGSRDPLERPSDEELEPEEDIFEPPEPFIKANSTSSNGNDTSLSNSTTGFDNSTTGGNTTHLINGTTQLYDNGQFADYYNQKQQHYPLSVNGYHQQANQFYDVHQQQLQQQHYHHHDHANYQFQSGSPPMATQPFNPYHTSAGHLPPFDHVQQQQHHQQRQQPQQRDPNYYQHWQEQGNNLNNHHGNVMPQQHANERGQQQQPVDGQRPPALTQWRQFSKEAKNNLPRPNHQDSALDADHDRFYAHSDQPRQPDPVVPTSGVNINTTPNSIGGAPHFDDHPYEPMRTMMDNVPPQQQLPATLQQHPPGPKQPVWGPIMELPNNSLDNSSARQHNGHLANTRYQIGNGQPAFDADYSSSDNVKSYALKPSASQHYPLTSRVPVQYHEQTQQQQQQQQPIDTYQSSGQRQHNYIGDSAGNNDYAPVQQAHYDSTVINNQRPDHGPTYNSNGVSQNYNDANKSGYSSQAADPQAKYGNGNGNGGASGYATSNGYTNSGGSSYGGGGGGYGSGYGDGYNKNDYATKVEKYEPGAHDKRERSKVILFLKPRISIHQANSSTTTKRPKNRQRLLHVINTPIFLNNTGNYTHDENWMDPDLKDTSGYGYGYGYGNGYGRDYSKSSSTTTKKPRTTTTTTTTTTTVSPDGDSSTTTTESSSTSEGTTTTDSTSDSSSSTTEPTTTTTGSNDDTSSSPSSSTTESSSSSGSTIEVEGEPASSTESSSGGSSSTTEKEEPSSTTSTSTTSEASSSTPDAEEEEEEEVAKSTTTSTTTTSTASSVPRKKKAKPATSTTTTTTFAPLDEEDITTAATTTTTSSTSSSSTTTPASNDQSLVVDIFASTSSPAIVVQPDTSESGDSFDSSSTSNPVQEEVASSTTSMAPPPSMTRRVMTSKPPPPTPLSQRQQSQKTSAKIISSPQSSSNNNLQQASKQVKQTQTNQSIQKKQPPATTTTTTTTSTTTTTEQPPTTTTTLSPEPTTTLLSGLLTNGDGETMSTTVMSNSNDETDTDSITQVNNLPDFISNPEASLNLLPPTQLTILPQLSESNSALFRNLANKDTANGTKDNKFSTTSTSLVTNKAAPTLIKSTETDIIDSNAQSVFTMKNTAANTVVNNIVKGNLLGDSTKSLPEGTLQSIATATISTTIPSTELSESLESSTTTASIFANASEIVSSSAQQPMLLNEELIEKLMRNKTLVNLMSNQLMKVMNTNGDKIDNNEKMNLVRLVFDQMMIKKVDFSSSNVRLAVKTVSSSYKEALEKSGASNSGALVSATDANDKIKSTRSSSHHQRSKSNSYGQRVQPNDSYSEASSNIRSNRSSKSIRAIDTALRLTGNGNRKNGSSSRGNQDNPIVVVLLPQEKAR